MGNLHGNSTAASADGKNRRNSNVKGRMLARFGHRSRSKAVLSAAEDEFTNVLERLGDAAAAADKIVEKLPAELSTVVLVHRNKLQTNDDDEDVDKRFSFLSQGADSAKDALDCGEFMSFDV